MRIHDCSAKVREGENEGVSASKGADREGVKNLRSPEEGVPTSDINSCASSSTPKNNNQTHLKSCVK